MNRHDQNSDPTPLADSEAAAAAHAGLISAQSAFPEPSPEKKDKPSFLKRVALAYRKASGGSMLLSIAIHAIILLIGTYLVVSQIVEERKISFGGGESGPKSEVQHKVKMKSMTAPAPNKRITTTSSLARVALPDMPNLPMNMGPSVAGAMGSGGFGAAGGLGGGGGGGGGSGGGKGNGFSKITFFGLNTGSKGEGLQGTFYDFKMTQGKRPTDTPRDMNSFIQIFQNFKSQTDFQKITLPHYTSPTKLFSKFVFFPGIQDSEAGPAFSSKDSKAGLWAAVYTGKFKANVPGRYRFVGTGDNMCAVKVNNDIVLDASDVQRSLGAFNEPREAISSVRKLGGKTSSTVFAGKWIDLDSREKTIDIVVGDQGGIFCAFVMIQRQGVKLEFDGNGIPKLPLFITAPLSGPEKNLLKELPREALTGPVFPATQGGSSLGSLIPAISR